MSRGVEIPDTEWWIRPNQSWQEATEIARGRRIREVDDLVREFGGTKRGWRKMKKEFWIESERTGDIVRRDIHWYEHHGVGRKKIKIKRWR